MFALAALALSAPLTYTETWIVNGRPTVVTITRHDSAHVQAHDKAHVPVPVPVGSFFPAPMPAAFPSVRVAPVCTTGRCPLQR
jgi:hypothetical protein